MIYTLNNSSSLQLHSRRLVVFFWLMRNPMFWAEFAGRKVVEMSPGRSKEECDHTILAAGICPHLDLPPRHVLIFSFFLPRILLQLWRTTNKSYTLNMNHETLTSIIDVGLCILAFACLFVFVSVSFTEATITKSFYYSLIPPAPYQTMLGTDTVAIAQAKETLHPKLWNQRQKHGPPHGAVSSYTLMFKEPVQRSRINNEAHPWATDIHQSHAMVVSLVLRRLSLWAGPLLSPLHLESLWEIWTQVSELLVPGSFMLIFTGKENPHMGKVYRQR